MLTYDNEYLTHTHPTMLCIHLVHSTTQRLVFQLRTVIQCTILPPPITFWCRDIKAYEDRYITRLL